jgi:predicted ATPase
MTNKYAVTGAPGAGKSTLLKHLSNAGHYTINEVAQYVKEIRATQGRPTAEEDRVGFQNEILQTQLNWESEIPKGIEAAFIDRGIPDGLAYYLIDARTPPRNLLDASKNANYKRVFFLEPGKIYVNTAVRPESYERAQELGRVTLQVYESLGYNVTKVPHLAKELQMRMILNIVEAS